MKNKVFFEGMRDGLPIGLGYFAVAFSLGIVARNAGLTPLQGFIASFFNVASAGEYALFTSIQAAASFLEIALITLVVNARYLLMSTALTQRFNPKTPMIHRFLVGFGVTDEIFGITIARPGYINPIYNYGALIVAVPLWSIGTSLGIIAGNFLPARVVSALSVALYGMFLAIIVPPSKKNIVIMISVLVSFAASYASTLIPYIKDLSGGTRTIILTVLISSVVALIKPIPDIEDNQNEEDKLTNGRSLNTESKEEE
ncbi:MAG: AzlC family ABC transporter permease [Treponema sp.]|nr:AzlC family ABC transporter permease [Treponema sp.]